MCPAVILANSLIARATDLPAVPIISRGNNIGVIQSGTPGGTKFKKWRTGPCLIIPTTCINENVTAARVAVTVILLVAVEKIGIKPSKFIKSIKKNRDRK